MIEFRWTKNSLFLILMLHFTAAVTGQRVPRFIVRGGDEVTLPCGHTIDAQSRCGEIDWIFSTPGSATTVRLFEKGQIGRNEDINRLSETETCSLVINKVTVKDAGFYTCRQFTSGWYRDANVYLFVITMTERRDAEEVELSFTLLTHRYCEYSLRWLYMEKDEDVETSRHTCKVTVKFPATLLNQESKYGNLFRCEVTDYYNEEKKQFDFSPQSSAEDATTAATALTMGTTVNHNKTRMDSPGPAVSDTPTPKGWWLYITVAAGLAALLIVVVAVVIWKRTKRKKTQTDENTVSTLNPAVTEPGPETSQDEADPEDGVSYASISFSKKSSSKAQALEKDEDVTYTTVKASSSSARASEDIRNLYATVNK
ncbi:uncharacterized protein [Chaetodon trifascialis]|uniref:uncharacterized protein n=1 Tax=Chaetodon trifascialis TaxID=109706 RepID=UPI003991AFD1